LAKTAFDQDSIWPRQHLAKTTFGQGNIWPRQHLAKTTFGPETWPRHQLFHFYSSRHSALAERQRRCTKELKQFNSRENTENCAIVSTKILTKFFLSILQLFGH
jgi:hypothetical protein